MGNAFIMLLLASEGCCSWIWILIKDKKRLVTDKDNYRPIGITSIVSKIVELVLERLQNELGTACNQFGFKKS